MPVQRAIPSEPVQIGGMKAQLSIIEHQRALQKNKVAMRQQEKDVEEDLQATSEEDSRDGSVDSVVVLTPSGNDDQVDEFDELQ